MTARRGGARREDDVLAPPGAARRHSKAASRLAGPTSTWTSSMCRFNRRHSKSRGFLLYRLMEQAIMTTPQPAKLIIGGIPKPSARSYGRASWSAYISSTGKPHFRRMIPDDLRLMHEWLQREHVRRWWSKRESHEEVVEHYLPAIEGHKPTDLYLITARRPPGRVHPDLSRVGLLRRRRARPARRRGRGSRSLHRRRGADGAGDRSGGASRLHP